MEKYNGLEIVRIVGTTSSGKRNVKIVECKCSCGNVVNVRLDNVKSGNTKSCGCYNKKLIMERNVKHNHNVRGKKSSEYISWYNMKQRCTNVNNHKYQIYGGRGISVCEEWMKFENYIKDMGLKPGPEYSIDRINVDGNYEPSNCRWSTPKEQANNRRNKL